MPDKEANADSGKREGSDAISLGERLSSARKARSITLEQASRTLRLDKAIVAALEAEQFEILGAAVFVKGHLRNYAELLGLAPDDVIECYRQLDPAIDELPATVVKQQRSERVNLALWSFWAMVIIAALLLVTVYLYEGPADHDVTRKRSSEAVLDGSAPIVEGITDSEGHSFEPADTSVQSPITARFEEVEAVTSLVTAENRSMAEQLPVLEPAEHADGAQASAVAAVPAAVGLPVVDPGRTRLNLIFRQDSWAEITDKRGRILYGLERAGTRRELSAEPPIDMWLGNAPGVDILVDGSAYSILPGVITVANTARFAIKQDIQP